MPGSEILTQHDSLLACVLFKKASIQGLKTRDSLMQSCCSCLVEVGLWNRPLTDAVDSLIGCTMTWLVVQWLESWTKKL